MAFKNREPIEMCDATTWGWIVWRIPLGGSENPTPAVITIMPPTMPHGLASAALRGIHACIRRRALVAIPVVGVDVLADLLIAPAASLVVIAVAGIAAVVAAYLGFPLTRGGRHGGEFVELSADARLALP